LLADHVKQYCLFHLTHGQRAPYAAGGTWPERRHWMLKLLDLMVIADMSVEVSAGDVNQEACPKTPLANWYCPFRPRSLTSTISIIVTWCPPKIFLHTPLSGPPQSASNRAPHVLKPALAQASAYFKSKYGPHDSPCRQRGDQVNHAARHLNETHPNENETYFFR